MRCCSAAGLLVLVFVGGLRLDHGLNPKAATESRLITEHQEDKQWRA